MEAAFVSNFEILASATTPLGVLCLRRRALISEPGTVVTEVTLNHEFLMSSYHTDSERALASRAIELHGGGDLRVLIGGLGLGYTAAEALDSGCVRRLEVVEYLPDVIDWMRGGLVPLSDRLNSDDRLLINRGDIYGMLAAIPEQEYDLILIDVDHSPDERLDTGPGFFYTRGGLELAKRHLAPNGVLGVWSYAESSDFSSAMQEVYGLVRTESIAFQNKFTDETSTDWLFFARV